MTAFFEDEPRTPAALSYIRNAVIGGETPYVYVTRRTYDRSDRTVTLTCMGGPEYPFHDPVYARDAPFPGPLLQAMDDEVRPYAQPARPPGERYDFHWHGLMGYNESGIRVIGAHPATRACSTTSAVTELDFSIHPRRRPHSSESLRSPARPEHLRPTLTSACR